MHETPVIAARHDDSFLIALPYGQRTDWLKSVLAGGSATIVANGHACEVGRPEVIPMAEATGHFRPREQRMHRQFRVDAALRVRQQMEAHLWQGRDSSRSRTGPGCLLQMAGDPGQGTYDPGIRRPPGKGWPGQAL